MAGQLAVAGCGRDGPYFGNTQPPARQEFVCTMFATGGSLDPAKCSDFLIEGQLIRTLFEAVIDYHPLTLEPMAGIATHYEPSPDGMRLNLFLRGHADPRGIRLPDTDTLPFDLTRGRTSVARRRPIHWTDGMPITAYDIVYSWRRALAPETAGPCAYLLYPIANAQAVNTGGLPPDKLAVRALDEYTVQVDLRMPAQFFLRVLPCITLLPVPRQAIESAQRRGAESTWTRPRHIVTSGAFTLEEWQPRDRVVLKRNPRYLHANFVGLERASFLFTNDASVGTNLYKSGQAHMMTSFVLPPVVVPALSGKRDLLRAPAFGTFYPFFNTRRAPFDNVLVRYAFNMATDKQAIADVFGFWDAPPLGRSCLHSRVIIRHRVCTCR